MLKHLRVLHIRIGLDKYILWGHKENPPCPNFVISIFKNYSNKMLTLQIPSTYVFVFTFINVVSK